MKQVFSDYYESYIDEYDFEDLAKPLYFQWMRNNNQTPEIKEEDGLFDLTAGQVDHVLYHAEMEGFTIPTRTDPLYAKGGQVKVGDIVTFRGQGKYEVIEQTPNSRTMFTIKDIDRGSGWDEDRNKYVGVHSEKGWHLGKNEEFGMESEVHKKFLKPITEYAKGGRTYLSYDRISRSPFKSHTKQKLYDMGYTYDYLKRLSSSQAEKLLKQNSYAKGGLVKKSDFTMLGTGLLIGGLIAFFNK